MTTGAVSKPRPRGSRAAPPVFSAAAAVALPLGAQAQEEAEAREGWKGADALIAGTNLPCAEMNIYGGFPLVGFIGNLTLLEIKTPCA